MKRLIDTLLSLFGLTLLMPAIVILGLIILATAGRPIIFSQIRVGRFGRPFALKKFRTMRTLKDADLGLFEPGKRDRVTNIGRFLRATKLDELPQLWNVLKGEMSMVGPRPEVRKWVDAFPKEWESILSVRPGITDPASLLYRQEEEILFGSSAPESDYRDKILPHKLGIYKSYVEDHSILKDIGIMVETIAKLFVN